MLPLLHFQSHAVTPPPANFTSLTKYDSVPATRDHTREHAAWYPRSFPIRTSQPTHGSATPSTESHYSFHPEHHLRRKTPNGTVDAGYDGSHTQLSHGPPPSKHLVMLAPGPSYSINGSSGHTFQRAQPPEYAAPSGVNRGRDGDDHTFRAAPGPWSYPSEATFQYGSFYGGAVGLVSPDSLLQPSANEMPGVFPTMYQPLMRANEYNVRAFCPPPAVMNDTLSLEQYPFHPSNIGMSRQNLPQPAVPLSAYAWKSSLPAGAFHNSHDIRQQAVLDPSIDTDAVAASQTSYGYFENASLSLGDGTQRFQRPHGFSGQEGFRDRVISQAYRSYTDLLVYAQNSRRPPVAKGNHSFAALPKLLVYPNPPKSFQDIPHSCHESDITASGKFASLPGSSHTVMRPHSNADASFVAGNLTPLETAKSSLEILSSLCEQSGWKWVDGILLGGCLHYVLGNYDKALNWFSTIMTLDSSHVAAITNMAAALYCLNRQDEAEQHWLRALKVQPNHLEAAEHLVGLLYKKRSKEAVDVISYIQDALRVSPPDSQDGLSSRAQIDSKQAQSQRISRQMPGLSTSVVGTSGYNLPARDNGRILALIHAKGTILYSLKDIKGASDAFEEAVLISVGRHMTGVPDLVRQIQRVLSPNKYHRGSNQQSTPVLKPLLLPPQKARHTAQLVFGGNGELPGLLHVPEGSARRAAVQTTSNSLLSLAKIFQDALSSGHASRDCRNRPSGVEDILALYYLSLSLQESPSTANNVGILLAGVQQTVSSDALEASADLTPSNDIPGIKPGSGLALALAYYHYGLRLDPKHVHLHTNLGSLLKDIGQLGLAIQMYEQAVACDGTFDIALTNLANAVKDRGKINDAIGYYKRAVRANPEFAEAVCGLSTALNSVCDWRGRGGVVLSKGQYDRWHVDDRGLLIDSYSERQDSGLTSRVVQIIGRQLREASLWGGGVLDDGVIAAIADQLRDVCPASLRLKDALKSWARKPWEGSRVVRLLERAVRATQWKWYQDRYVVGNETPSGYRRPRLPIALTVPSAPTVLPFHTFTCPLSAREIRAISQRNAIRISSSTLRLPWLPATVYPPPPPPSPQLNVGYVSSDFNNHPLAHLMQSVFGFHNPQRAKAFCYATTASDKSAHRRQIEQEAPVFRDVSNWSSERLVEQIVQDEIHILVNLNGYTRGARNEIFAARPAPIQMSFMGFAGTLGAEWCDYLLADNTAIPRETLRPWRSNVGLDDIFADDTEGEKDGWMYSENIIFCRDTFFCCDHAQSCDPGERQVTWEEEQKRRWKMRKQLFRNLADDTIILGNFNQLYKIEPTTFRTWLRILAQVPKAILWLLRFPEPGESHLRRTAQDWAGQEVASRIVFTDVAPKNQHISRARVCDLFLDTPECNAHTTAADVLWSSTPLLTLPRYPYKMCSRMAASILKGALPKTDEGLQASAELIAGSEEEYEQWAVRLAGGLTYDMTSGSYCEGRGRLAEMRRLLWTNKWHCGLFDTRRWVEDVETAYEEAWKRWSEGKGGDIQL